MLKVANSRSRAYVVIKGFVHGYRELGCVDAGVVNVGTSAHNASRFRSVRMTVRSGLTIAPRALAVCSQRPRSSSGVADTTTAPRGGVGHAGPRLAVMR